MIEKLKQYSGYIIAGLLALLTLEFLKRKSDSSELRLDDIKVEDKSLQKDIESNDLAVAKEKAKLEALNAPVKEKLDIEQEARYFTDQLK